MRLIDADELNEYIGRESLDTREKIFALVDRMPTLPNPCGKPCAFERPHEMWEYLKEHITEMRDVDGGLNQKQTCQFILELMGVIEREGNENEQSV